MTILLGALAALGAISGWTWFVRAVYRIESGADEVHYARTDDGWRVALSRYRARGTPRRHPVLLCHGLASSHLNFDPSPDTSLARHLSLRGYETWALDLRGHGRSDRPGPGTGRRSRWTFDDYLLRDLPAAIGHVLSQTGRPALHWIGHSMGGLLLYARLARGGSTQVRSGVAIGSSLDYSRAVSDFRRGLRLRPLGRVLRVVPLGLASVWLAPFAGRIRNPLERFNWWPTNVDPRLVRRLLSCAYTNVPTSLLLQLATAFMDGGLRTQDGRSRYIEGLGSATTPVLAIAGDRDRQCSPEAARATVERLGSASGGIAGTLRVFGKEHGQADHYGHCDLVMGRRARHEVFPAIDEWLDGHD
jgi:alpha-beta hydrolase superfamily lysophospholipase